MNKHSLSHLADSTVVHTFSSIVARDRATTAEMLLFLGEIDERRLHVAAGYPSMYAYCVGKHFMSEDVACKRICAARMARKFPVILDAVADGRLHLTAIVLLAAARPTPENADELFAAAAYKTKSQVEQLLAHWFPKPDVPTQVQEIAAPSTPRTGLSAPGRIGALTLTPDSLPLEASVETSPESVVDASHAPLAARPVSEVAMPRAKVAPLAPQRYAVHMTIDQETHDVLREVQDLLGHQVAAGDVATVFYRALKELVAVLKKQKCAATDKPRVTKSHPSKNARHVPAAVKREVSKRDGRRCTFVSNTGHRCESRLGLEFDHIEPVARGGQATVGNLRLRCRAHNQYEAERAFGREFISRKRDEARCAKARSALATSGASAAAT